MVYSYSYLSVIFKVSWSTDVAQNFQNSLIRSIHILASLIYSPGICFYDKYIDSFTHVRVLLYIWYGETVHKRKNVNRGPRSNFLAECVPRPIKFGQPCLADETLHPMKLVSKKKKNLALEGINDVAVKVVDDTNS